MADYEQADARLMDWLAERTDEQLQRLLDAPEDGLDNDNFYLNRGCACLAGWAFGLTTVEEASDFLEGPAGPEMHKATDILCDYRLYSSTSDDGRIMRRIQGFAAAELLTRRVERPKLPAPVEVVA